MPLLIIIIIIIIIITAGLVESHGSLPPGL